MFFNKKFPRLFLHQNFISHTTKYLTMNHSIFRSFFFIFIFITLCMKIVCSFQGSQNNMMMSQELIYYVFSFFLIVFKQIRVNFHSFSWKTTLTLEKHSHTTKCLCILRVYLKSSGMKRKYVNGHMKNNKIIQSIMPAEIINIYIDINITYILFCSLVKI